MIAAITTACTASDQIAGRAQRKRPQQCGELIADRSAREPVRDRFGEAEDEHRDAAADHAALEPEPAENAAGSGWRCSGRRRRRNAGLRRSAGWPPSRRGSRTTPR